MQPYSFHQATCDWPLMRNMRWIPSLSSDNGDFDGIETFKHMNNDVEAGRAAAVGGSWNSIENCFFHFFSCYSILGSISGEAKKIRRNVEFLPDPASADGGGWKRWLKKTLFLFLCYSIWSVKVTDWCKIKFLINFILSTFEICHINEKISHSKRHFLHPGSCTRIPYLYILEMCR